jgi:hypothetical protein
MSAASFVPDVSTRSTASAPHHRWPSGHGYKGMKRLSRRRTIRCTSWIM